MFDNNLPPGVIASMIPGDSPEDEYWEYPLLISEAEIELLFDFVEKQAELKNTERHELYDIIYNLVEQLKEY